MISVVINYCTLDERFIRKCIDEALVISGDVIIPISDHLYDGTPENMESIKKLTEEYRNKITICIYKWNNNYPPRYWHNYSRLIGSKLAKNDYVLFIDSDEIIDSELFVKFLSSTNIDFYDSYKFDCYWYFREPKFRAKQTENSQVMIRKSLININLRDPCHEREQLFELLQSNRKLNHVKFNNEPMIHHYSWVRTKEQMLNKVKSWGHNKDRDWTALINEEFSREFNGRDFIHGYEYEIKENKYNL